MALCLVLPSFVIMSFVQPLLCGNYLFRDVCLFVYLFVCLFVCLFVLPFFQRCLRILSVLNLTFMGPCVVILLL